MKFRALSVYGGILRQNSVANIKQNSAHEILPRTSPVKFHNEI
nr:hypothetical protein [uncultured Campylobacter sp.]